MIKNEELIKFKISSLHKMFVDDAQTMFVKLVND
jgi:hypothetical protein